MPVRIRLAYHPLARKKEPLYHIVAAKSKTGRQRKPLEVIGVYDPIPRHPTLPNGQVLENEDKVKKISMNIDRVKYWLSVGAQPTDHCARLFAKANLIPKKPLYKDRASEPFTKVSTGIKHWGHMNQGLEALPRPGTQTPKKKGETTPQSKVAGKAAQLESEVRKFSIDLVAGVMKESGDTAPIIHPGRPNLLSLYVHASPQQLHAAVSEFCKQHETSSNVDFSQYLEQEFDKYSFAFIPLRFFMAYVQPLPDRGERYNFVRYKLFEGWMNMWRTTKKSRVNPSGEELVRVLKRMFYALEKVVKQLQDEGILTQKEWDLRDLIQQRAQLWRLADKDKDLREKELDGWKEIWEIGQYGWSSKPTSEEWNPPLQEKEESLENEVGTIVDSTLVSAEDVKAPETKADVVEPEASVEPEISTEDVSSSEGESKEGDAVADASSKEVKP